MSTQRKGESREDYLERARAKQRIYEVQKQNKLGREGYLQAMRDYNKIKRERLTPEEKDERVKKLQDQVTYMFWGLTPEARQKILDCQGGGCAICGRPDERSRYGRLHVDHCHKTGKLRGLLCQRCNRGIGWLLDSAELAERAAAYLREGAKWEQLRILEER